MSNISMPAGSRLTRAKETTQRWYGEALYDIWGNPISRLPSLWESIESGLATYTGGARNVFIDGVLTEIPKDVALVVDRAVLVCPDGYDWSQWNYKRIVRKTNKCWYVEE